MERALKIERQIIKNIKTISNLKLQQRGLKHEIAANDEKFDGEIKKKNKFMTTLSVTSIATAVSLLATVFFPTSVIAAALTALSFTAFATTTAISLVWVYRNVKLCDKNIKNRKSLIDLNNEEIEILSQNEQLQKELDDLLVVINKEEVKQNLKLPKVLHTKVFKQFNKYLQSKQSKLNNNELSL